MMNASSLSKRAVGCPARPARRASGGAGPRRAVRDSRRAQLRKQTVAGWRRAAGRPDVAARAGATTDLPPPTATYDYIIVGGGLSGCLLANRLSEDPAKSVLLLEAGEDNTDSVVKVPVGITRLFQHPTLDWNLKTVTDMYLARGKLLGGSSSTNATLYHRGTAKDYDGWGLPGWAADDVLPWFKQAEDNPAYGNSKWHNTGGAMHVEKPIYQNKLFDAFFAGATELGLKPNDDFNDWSHEQDGFGDFQVSITARGRRADAHRSFLKPILGRGNLTVVTRAQTKRILFEQRGGRPHAVGVEVHSVRPGAAALSTGKSTTVSTTAGGEVILACGAVHSPQLLMLSGVGPKQHLADVGVPVVADSPAVGGNLQDHPAVLSAFKLKESAGRIAITDHIYHNDGSIRKRQLLNWAVLGKGALTSTACDRGAFVRTSARADQPDLQIRCAPGLALNPDGVGSFVEFGRMKEAGDVDRWPSGVTFQIIACRPQSRGTVRLASASVSDRPRIDVAYLSDAGGADRATLREGLRMSRKLAETAAWQALLESELHPGAEKQTDGELDAYIDATIHSANALTGTCTLGAAGRGVVSPADFSVYGVGGLRVADSSVIPTIPGGQTGAPTVMIAERAAALLTEGRASITGMTPQLAMA